MKFDMSSEGIFTHIMQSVQKLKMEYNAEFRVAFYTSVGRIECDIEPHAGSDSMIGLTDDPTLFTVDLSALFEGYDNSQLINAKNVTIYTHDDTCMKTDQMLIFADKIIGFSLVRKNH